MSEKQLSEHAGVPTQSKKKKTQEEMLEEFLEKEKSNPRSVMRPLGGQLIIGIPAPKPSERKKDD